MRRSLLPVLVIGLATGPSARGQTVQGPTFRTGIDVLLVDATVLDGRGTPIPDLAAPEFTVKVDGRERKVVSAEYVAATGGGSRPDDLEPVHYSTNVGAGTGRLIVLVVDQGYMQSGEGRSVASALGGFLDQLTPSDRIALHTIPQPGPSVDFTANHRAIRAALGRIVGHATATRGDFNLGLAEAVMLVDGLDPVEQRDVMNRECGPTLGPDGRRSCEDEVRSDAIAIVAEVRTKTRQTLQALRNVLDRLTALDAPKTVVLISGGLVIEERSGELLSIAEAAAQARAAISVALLEQSFHDVTIADVPRTPIRDRTLYEEGLGQLAGMTRGAVFRDVGGGAGALDRIHRAMSGYYLLGVESEPSDRDLKRHQIEVEVRRRGATVWARREFLYGGRARTPLAGEALVRDALGSPILATDLPLRVSSYAFQDRESAGVRVVIAAEIDGPQPSATDYLVGLALADQDGRVVTGGVQRRGRDAAADGPLEYVGALVVEPGTYNLKVAAADATGRRGSVEHTLQAWKMAGEEFAVGDLILTNAPIRADAAPPPGVLARLDSGRLAAYTELYANDPALLDAVVVSVDVGEDESGPALAKGVAELERNVNGQRRDAHALLAVDTLPPGRYLARVTIAAGGRTIGKLSRPFEVVRRPAVAGAPSPRPGPTAAPTPAARPGVRTDRAPFDRDATLAPEVVGYFLGTLEQARASGSAAVRSAIANAKQGRWQGSGRQAFEAGDQLAAAFLRGMELYVAGEIPQAAIQFRTALTERPGFAPATFYLAACLSAAGQDREAIGLWAKEVPADAPAGVYGLVADAWLRVAEAEQAIGPLRAGLARHPQDETLRRRLGVAQLAEGRLADGLTALEPYLAAHPEDHDTLFAVLQAIYEALAAGRDTAGVDRNRLATYANAYAAAKGPNTALVAKWVESLGGAPREGVTPP